MPLQTHATIRIKGHPGLADTFSLLSLREQIFDHHRFSLTLSARAFGCGDGTADWRGLVGRRITIEISPLSSPPGGSGYDSKVWSGLITGLQLGKAHGPNGVVTLSGGSPTLLTDDDPHMVSFSGQSLKRIASEALGHYPANLLRPQIDPATTGTLDYVVQYKENTWDFLRRLARTHGEWFYYDGQQVIFGRLRPEMTRLTHEMDLDNFSLQMGLRPANTEWTGHSYDNDEGVRTVAPVPSGLDPYTQAVADQSRPLFARTGRLTTNRLLNGMPSGSVNQAAVRRQEASVAEMVRMHGTSHHPGLAVGNHVSVSEALEGNEAYGEYMLTQVEHRCSSDGDYTNSFEGIPAEAAAPPHRLDDHPHAETQSAVVMDNNDPDDLGRLQVQLRWQDGRTPWLRTVTPAGGHGKGLYMIPEKGEEVLVGFAGGNPERPYVLGAAWNGGGPSGFGTPKNDIKAIKTRSGHTIELNDKEGAESITIRDKNGNSVYMDTNNKSITINAPGDMTLNAKNMDMNIQENLNVNVGKSKTEHITEDHNLEARNSTAKILKKRMVRSGEKTEQQAGELIIHTSNGDMTLDGTGKVRIQSKDRIDFGE